MIKTEDLRVTPSLAQRGESREYRPLLTDHAEVNHDSPEIVIRPHLGWIPIDWKELFAYRELLFFLICAISRYGTSRQSWARRGQFCNLCC